MKPYRRAATRGPSPATAAAIGGALVFLSTTLAGVIGTMGLLSLRVARQVVRPAGRVADTRIVSLDTAAQTITLSRTPDTALPGRYGLFTTGTETYLKLGSVLAQDAATVKRKLLTEVDARSSLGPDAAFSGWYFDDPEQLQLPFTAERIGTPLGPCPAWLFPAPQASDLWVIQVHGRGTTRAECLRAVPEFRALGFTTLVVAYRNDGEAPPSATGTYGLGATEWRDVDAAVGFALRAGARRIVLMGWSMGGAIALQVALNSDHADAIAGLILESPVIDWRVVLDYQAKLKRLPATVKGLAIGALQWEWPGNVARTGPAIPFDRLDVVARAAELRHPILILHSDDDGFVPSDASHDLVVARPDLVEMQVFEVARHTKLWNYDQERWTAVISDWLERNGIIAESAVEGS